VFAAGVPVAEKPEACILQASGFFDVRQQTPNKTDPDWL
jgi:hypothetical protein